MTFENYKKKYMFNSYEKTSCIIYEMYIRAENIEADDFNTSDDFNPFFDVPRIKDINLYSSNDKVISLQNIIYNIYPDIYIDAIIWILQYRILEQVKYIKQCLSEIDIYKYIKTFFDNYERKIDPSNNRLDSKSKLFDSIMYEKLTKICNIIDRRQIILEERNIGEYEKEFEHNAKEPIIRCIYNIKDNSSIEFKKLSNILNEKFLEINFMDKFYKNKQNLFNASTVIGHIISNIQSLVQEFRVFYDVNVDSREIDVSGFNDVIKNHLKVFSFPLEYLKKEYLENKSKQFNRQIIENHYNGSYIRITQTYIEEVIKNYLLNLRITPNFKRPIHKLQHIFPLSTLHNINLSLPLDELVEYIKELKKLHFKNSGINEDSKYEIIHLNKKINIKENLENLEDCVKILYIYDKKKKVKVDDILKELEIGRTKYYKLKKIADIYIDEKKYIKLYSN